MICSLEMMSDLARSAIVRATLMSLKYDLAERDNDSAAFSRTVFADGASGRYLIVSAGEREALYFSELL